MEERSDIGFIEIEPMRYLVEIYNRKGTGGQEIWTALNLFTVTRTADFDCITCSARTERATCTLYMYTVDSDVA